MNIDWQVISTFDLKKCNFEMLQFQMSNLYGSKFTESTRSNYMKFLNIMQMIIFYNEYCNIQLNETNQQIDRDISTIDEQIAKQEAKLLKSKRHIQKCRQFRSDLKKIKSTKNLVYGCLYCNLEFKDTLTLDRHFESHTPPPNLMPQLLIIQKELQAQLALVYETKQQRRQLQFMKEDLNCGMLATAERNQQLLSDEKLKGLIQTYEHKVKRLQDLLQSLDGRVEENKLHHNDEWLDELKNEINEELNNKKEEEKLVQRQLNDAARDLKRAQTLQKQNSIVMKGKGQFSQSEMKPSLSQIKSMAYIQSQEGGANHRFNRNRQQARNSYSDEEIPQHDEIIIEEEDQSPNQREPHQRDKSSQIQLKPKHSKNPSGVSIFPSDTSSKQAMTTFEKYELRQKEFNKLVCDILQNRFFLRRTQFTDDEIQKERIKVDRKLENITSDDLENELQQLRLENKQFANRKRYQIKTKKAQNQSVQENQERENTITTLESSSDEEMSEKKSADDDKEGPQILSDLPKFPFNVRGNNDQLAKTKQEDQHTEKPKGYGINDFSLNF